MYRVHNTYPTGEKIVKGIRHDDSGFYTTDISKFKLYIANTLDPTNETELNVKVINDYPYFWTEPFVIWFQGEYILHWVNEAAGINFKQTFTVTDHVSQQKIQVKGGRLKG